MGACVHVNLFPNRQTRLQHLVDQASERAVDIVSRLGTRFKRVHALFRPNIEQFPLTDLPLVD